MSPQAPKDTTGKKQGQTKRIVLSLLLVLLFVVNLTNTIDQSGDAYFTKALATAATTYVLARGINGTISLIQDAELSATPAGVGVSFSPGEILDPLNDLIEQFSTVMLVATGSLGIQKFLHLFSGWWGAKLAAAVAIILALVMLYLAPARPGWQSLRPALSRLLLLALCIRFLVPLVAVLNGFCEEIFLEREMATKIDSIRLVEESISTVDPLAEEEEKGFFNSLSSHTKDLLHYREKAAILKEKVSGAVANIIDLIALFVIQTILLPLLFLFFAYRMLNWLLVPRRQSI